MAAGRRAYWKGGEMGRQTEETDEKPLYVQIVILRFVLMLLNRFLIMVE